MTNLIHDGMREKSGGTGGVVGSYVLFYNGLINLIRPRLNGSKWSPRYAPALVSDELNWN